MSANFSHTLAVEMRRALHRRLVRWMIALALAWCAFTGVVVYVTSGDPAELARADAHPAFMRTWWSTAGGDAFLITGAVFLVVGAAICGASVAGAEWRAGTITTMLTWQPSRLRLHGARTASAGILSFVIGLGLQAAFLASALPAVLLHGNADGVDGAWWVGLAAAMVRISFVTALVAVLAVSIATLGRNTSVALIVIAGWALVAERTIAALRPGLARFLIAENVATVVPWKPMTGVEFDRTPVVALASLVVYLAVIVALATFSFSRRDVAAVT
jgi:hypothetical protein